MLLDTAAILSLLALIVIATVMVKYPWLAPAKIRPTIYRRFWRGVVWKVSFLDNADPPRVLTTFILPTDTGKGKSFVHEDKHYTISANGAIWDRHLRVPWAFYREGVSAPLPLGEFSGAQFEGVLRDMLGANAAETREAVRSNIVEKIMFHADKGFYRDMLLIKYFSIGTACGVVLLYFLVIYEVNGLHQAIQGIRFPLSRAAP